MKTLSFEEAEAAARERDTLIAACLSRGAQSYSGNRSKLFTGALSPGCVTCAEGTWSCLYVNVRCTRSCFFCPQNRSVSVEPPPREGTLDVEIDSADDYLEFVQAFGFRGVGFSGGEPLMAFDTLIEYLKKLRSALGPELYVWAYTSGDLVDAGKLRALAREGLDELRFNLSARHYDLSPVEEAVEHFGTVTVEIPAIPEDLDRVMALLPALQRLGVSFLNVHQLYFTEHNRAALRRRGYTPLHQGERQPVLESELAALRILKHALVTGLRLPVNYCSVAYKMRFQSRGRRIRLAHYRSGGRTFQPDFGSVTATGLIRRLYVEGTGTEVSRLAGSLEGSERRFALSETDDRRAVLYLHPSLLGAKPLDDRVIKVAYHELTLGDEPPHHAPDAAYDVGETAPSVRMALQNEVATFLFKALFVDSTSVDEAANQVSEVFEVDLEHASDLREHTQRFHAEFEGLEFLPSELPEYV